MAGRVSICVVAALLLCAFGYAVGKLEARKYLLPFKIVQVARDNDPERIALSGMKPPFTVLVHETRVNMNLPGEFGQPGDEVWLPDPRYSSSSTSEP